MKKLYSAGIVTYIMENEEPVYLLLHYTAGHWDFPKGTMEIGETKEETALRELQEETGLTAVIDTKFEESTQYYTHYHHEPYLKTVYYFVGKTNNKNVVVSYEHSGFKWLPYKSALEQITYDGSKTILEQAHKYISSQLKS